MREVRRMMKASILAAKERGVAVGAHPGFDDREISAAGKSRSAGKRSSRRCLSSRCLLRGRSFVRRAPQHVKPHGALYNMAVRNDDMADAIARAVKAIDPRPIFFAPVASALSRAAEFNELRVAREVFADRNYMPDGTLVSRDRPDALLHDPVEAANRVFGMLRESKVRAIDGSDVHVEADTICLHGDKPGAVAFARELRKCLLPGRSHDCSARRGGLTETITKNTHGIQTTRRLRLKVPVLSFGTGTFGGKGEFFNAWGSSDVAEATRLVDICLEAGLNMFDSADVYSDGLAEEILGQAIKGRRDDVLISTKATFRSGDGPNDVGSSRLHLTRAVEAALRRLGTDHIDLFQLHGFDALTPRRNAQTLDDLVRAGKIRYIGCSNFSGWHLMKSLAISEKYGLARYVAHQAYYSLIGRDYEWELMPLGLDQKVGAVVWSPLGWGRLTGKIRRGPPPPEKSRLNAKASTKAGRRSTTNISSKSSTRSMGSPRKPARPCRRSR